MGRDSLRSVGTKRFPGYGCLLSWPLLPSVCPPQNLSVQRGGSLRPNGEGAFLACPLIIHDAHDQSLLLVLPDIRMYSETPFDAGMEWVYPHCLLLGGHGLVDPHLGDLLPSGDGIRAVLTLCCSSSPRVPNQLASFLPPLRALLPLSLAPVPRVSSGAWWGGTRENPSLPSCSDHKFKQHSYQDISQSVLCFPIFASIPPHVYVMNMPDLLNFTHFSACIQIVLSTWNAHSPPLL